MAETTADVRRDIELTRERMSTTLQELEQRLNLMQVVKEHPWPALAVAFGAGLVLSGSGADQRAAEATSAATRSFSRQAGGRVGPALDGLVADLLHGVRSAFEDRIDTLITDVRHSILGSQGTQPGQGGAQPRRAAADLGGTDGGPQSYAGAGTSPGGAYNVSEVTGMGSQGIPRAD